MENTAKTITTSNEPLEDMIYWGIDASNKLIISDQPVASATEDRIGSFAKDATFIVDLYKDTTDAPWSAYAAVITSVEVKGHVAPVSTANWFYKFVNAKSMELSQLDTSNVTDMFDQCGLQECKRAII